MNYVTLDDKEFWFGLDAHLAESEFAKNVRDKQGYVLYDYDALLPSTKNPLF